MKRIYQEEKIEVHSYGKTEPGREYIILVYGLWGMDGEYRVCLTERYGARDSQIADVNLHKSCHRRWLEQYVARMKDSLMLSGVYFSNTGCQGDNYYALEDYKKRNNMLRMGFLEDLQIPAFS